MTERRFALIIATDQYKDEYWCQLISPVHDAEALALTLKDPAIGNFNVQTLINMPSYEVRKEIESFFNNKEPNNLLLLYFSCHGFMGNDGLLYYVHSDTTRELLRSTAIDAQFVNNVIQHSPSKKRVLLLDCCYSGAFAGGYSTKSGKENEIKGYFEGRGFAVITACNAIQQAYEGDSVEGKAMPSVFTSSLVHGLKTGEADTDGDGYISINDLYDFVYSFMRDKRPEQQPQMSGLHIQGKIIIARNPNLVVRPVALPQDLIDAMNNSTKFLERVGSVHLLRSFLHGEDKGLSLSAHDALKKMQNDDSSHVREVASKTLDDYVKTPPEKKPVHQPPNVNHPKTSRLMWILTATTVFFCIGMALMTIFYIIPLLKNERTVAAPQTTLTEESGIENGQPVAQTEELQMYGGEFIFVVCTRDGAELRDKPEPNAHVIKTIPWMTNYVVTKRTTDALQREWIRVGVLKTFKEAIPQGWMLKDDLLMRMEAYKEEGVYKKAIVVTLYNKATESFGGAPVRHAPLMSASRVGQELTPYHIFYVYEEHEDIQGEEIFYLIGFQAISDPTKPENSIIGWVPGSKLFLWNTREAAEYDKSTLEKRNPVRIYEREEDVSAVIRGEKTPEQVHVLAIEAVAEKEMVPEDFRFPIIGKEFNVDGVKVWKIGFPGGRASPVAMSTTPSPVLDILFVYDGMGSMYKLKDALVSVVQNVQSNAKEYWQANWKEEKQPIIRISMAMYKDYITGDAYKRVPLDNDNQKRIIQFINNNAFTGGDDRPPVFHGLSQAIKDAKGEFEKDSFRLVFLIGCMGNMGVSDKDPKGYKVDDMVMLLRENNCDFYAIHVAGDIIPPTGITSRPWKKFEGETKAIINQLAEGTAKYVSVVSAQEVKNEINKVIIELLDQRFRVIQKTVEVSTAVASVNDIAKSGTLLAKRVLDQLELNGIEINKIMNGEKKQTMSVFGIGYVTTTEPGTAIRAVKSVVLADRREIEALIALLGRLIDVRYEHVEKGWVDALQATTGEQIDDHKIIPADIIKKHYGLPVKSSILNMSFTDIGKLQPAQVQAACKDFEKKLFLLRGVVNEKEVSVEVDDKGNITSKPIGDKRYFFGTRNSERAWLDIDVYLP